MSDIEEMLGFDHDTRPKPIRRAKTRQNLGPLHELLTEKLPDLTGPGGVCDLHKLAKELSMTYQGVYKWMPPKRKNQLPFKQVKRIVALSERQKRAPEGFVPATEADFHPYIS